MSEAWNLCTSRLPMAMYCWDMPSAEVIGCHSTQYSAEWRHVPSQWSMDVPGAEEADTRVTTIISPNICRSDTWRFPVVIVPSFKIGGWMMVHGIGYQFTKMGLWQRRSWTQTDTHILIVSVCLIGIIDGPWSEFTDAACCLCVVIYSNSSCHGVNALLWTWSCSTVWFLKFVYSK